MREFEPEMPDARLQPVLQVDARFLRFRAENSVAAAGIGDNRMGAAIPVAKFDLVGIAGTSAIQIARARG